MGSFSWGLQEASVHSNGHEPLSSSPGPCLSPTGAGFRDIAASLQEALSLV